MSEYVNRLNFAGILDDLGMLGRNLTLHEIAFLRACEAAGYEMSIEKKLDGPPFFSLEHEYGNPMNYPSKARVEPETLRVLMADTTVLRADLERIVAKTKWDGREAVLLLKAAGFIVGRERKGDMVTVGRGAAHIWLDTGGTVRYTEDPSDSDRELLLDVVEVLEGPAKRAWLKAKIIENA